MKPKTLADTYNEVEQERIASVTYNVNTAKSKQVGGMHYKEMGVEPWDVIDTWSYEQRVGAYRAGALKYIMRMGHKDQDLQEINKGIHYLEKLLEVLKGQQ